MMKNLRLAPLLAFGLALCASAAFAAGEGTAVGVKPDAVARAGSQDRLLAVGTDVSVGELIVTGPSGQVQVVFDDNTRLVVGPGSSLLIEDYLLASNNTAQKLTINALGGTFRFITGNSAKPAYSIKTPTAAIAVRGTEFDFIVEPQDTRVMLYSGALQICTRGNDCAQVTERCEIGAASRTEAVVYGRSDPSRPPLSQQYRYARVQAPLLPEFRIGGATNCVGAPAEAASPESLSSSDGGARPTATNGITTPTTGPTTPTTGPTNPTTGPTVP